MNRNRPRRGPNDRPAQFQTGSSIPIEQILQGDPEKIDASARDVAQQCASLKLSKTQIRNFYGPIVRLRSEDVRPENKPAGFYARALLMHAARLAYAAARDEKAKPLQQSFDKLVRAAVKDNSVETKALQAIYDFSEAVVAYHYSLS